ncbi:MAG TPA: hypothetical protein DEG17_18485 [Cyanobacteria bacterium UBA11149]|nr:hypothetical protein [Cyanobacteria bacterium UBA11367]HBE60093.1 hypothetical protein [Cyanobacteria bacterium UBA11366]HBR73222.1 hypothetical protein [Cyanobacteria bacterium UBA11159]HBS71623.1 hypothetical protein [Cyanobacteria bacterium UBA11153]HBW90799.1 hypothetical protein [Cyanobacteria bacterium UBA11149]HCA97707.1 hypothetical protein [Cyanobacteria bacterium UBA9226]
MFKTLKLIYLYLTVLNLSIFTLSARAEITQQIDLNKPVISIDLYRYYRYSNLLDKLRETEIKISENSLKFREDSSVIQVLQQQKQNLLDLLDSKRRLGIYDTFPRDVCLRILR